MYQIFFRQDYTLFKWSLDEEKNSIVFKDTENLIKAIFSSLNLKKPVIVSDKNIESNCEDFKKFHIKQFDENLFINFSIRNKLKDLNQLPEFNHQTIMSFLLHSLS